MKNSLLGLFLCLLASQSAASVPGRVTSEGIHWRASLSGALDEAQASGSAVFVVLNMDGEKANDELANFIYRDKLICELAAGTINVVGSSFEHTPAPGICARFGSVTCREHQDVEKEIRKRLLGVPSSAPIVAPQHFFLTPDGDPILAVPYGISRPELEWCFGAAYHHQGTAPTAQGQGEARPPKRLVMSKIPSTEELGLERLLSREEALAAIEVLKRGLLKGKEESDLLLALMRTDEPETLKYMETLLRKSGRRKSSKDPRLAHIANIGRLSPPSYWSLLTPLIGSGGAALQNQAIVALEQLGAPDSLKALRKALGKQRDPAILKNLLRAVASAGAGDKKVRKDLLKRSAKSKDLQLRVNAILALGYLAPHEDISTRLNELAGSESTEERMAAACAMALTRDRKWVEVLVRMNAAAKDPSEQATLKAVQVAFEQGDLRYLGKVVGRLAGDELGRPRLFGRE